MDHERRAWIEQLAQLLASAKWVASTSLCGSGPFTSVVWRIVPDDTSGVVFLLLGRNEKANEQVLFQFGQQDIWELFANTPLDPLAFTQDPNQETHQIEEE